MLLNSSSGSDCHLPFNAISHPRLHALTSHSSFPFPDSDLCLLSSDLPTALRRRYTACFLSPEPSADAR